MQRASRLDMDRKNLLFLKEKKEVNVIFLG
jgi:hypothetical protein